MVESHGVQNEGMKTSGELPVVFLRGESSIWAVVKNYDPFLAP